ncbi:MAG: hypothetical protein JWO08_3277, partial [Verrucomicrobiaceae bacterium]|nr:hypothetical protein [Verrucomicrobiaceae bacterium]
DEIARSLHQYFRDVTVILANQRSPIGCEIRVMHGDGGLADVVAPAI